MGYLHTFFLKQLIAGTRSLVFYRKFRRETIFYLYLMKKSLMASCFCFFSIWAFSQSDDVEKLHENAKAFMRQGDYANASLILTRALGQAPGNVEIAKDLAY